MNTTCSERPTTRRFPSFAAALLVAAVAVLSLGCGQSAAGGGGASVPPTDTGGGLDSTVFGGGDTASSSGGSSADGASSSGACTPNCGANKCGPDGCGGTCGFCKRGEDCKAGACTGGCTPVCSGKACGPDGCGGICGTCPSNASCELGVCKTKGCQPVCAGKDCGNDGCGGVCGLCTASQACVQGTCKEKSACKPACAGKVCGHDGCGGDCGSCAQGQNCIDGACITPQCKPQCTGKKCGKDGCGGVCGVCSGDQKCVQGACEGPPPCKPKCDGKKCGADGCGGSCGTCKATEQCQTGKCVTPPPPQCGKVSYEGCCGNNQVLQYCSAGQLKVTQCGGGKVCGWNVDKKYYDCIDAAKCKVDCVDPSGKHPKYCKGDQGVPVVHITFLSAVVAPFKADRCQWDGVFCSAVKQSDAKKLGDITGKLLTLVVGKAGWVGIVKDVLGFVAAPAMNALAKPDPYGWAQIFKDGKWSGKLTLVDVKNKTNDTYTPIFPSTPSFNQVALKPGVRLRVTFFDDDWNADDPIGVAEISYKEIKAVLDSGKSQYVDTAKSTSNQLLLVKISVAKAN